MLHYSAIGVHSKTGMRLARPPGAKVAKFRHAPPLRRRLGPATPAAAAHESEREPGEALEVDSELLGALRLLIRAVCHEMGSRMESCREAGSERVAAAALAAAEANGAVPPLTARQRQALRTALSQAAAAATESGQSLDEDWELAPDDRSGFDEGLVVAIKPLAKEAYETLINQHTHASPGEHTASPHDSVGAGGEVGNIGLQSASGHTSAHAPRGVPAESRSDRAEHAVEKDFMELELGDPESGRTGGAARGGPRAPPRVQEHGLEHSLLMDQSDAPAAGDGMQAMGEPGTPAWRPIREHYERHEPPTEGS